MRTCLLLFLVSSWEPWFSQVAPIHTYLGAFTLQVACSSTKNYNHISLLSSPSSHSISVPIWIPKHVLGSFLAFYSVFLLKFHVLFGSYSLLLDSIGSSSFPIDLIRCISISKQFKWFICFLTSFSRFNWQEMGLPCELWCLAQVLVSSWIIEHWSISIKVHIQSPTQVDSIQCQIIIYILLLESYHGC